MTTDVVKQIRRATRRRFTAEEKIHIVLEGLRGEIPVTETVPQRRDSTFDLLQVVQGLPGFGQKRSNPGDPTECDFR